MANNNSIFNIKYKKQFIATAVSQIQFFEGTPQLEKIFLEEDSSTSPLETASRIGMTKGKKARRLFVMDTNVAQLDCVKAFLENFGENEEIRRRCTQINADGTQINGTGAFQGDALIIVNAGEEYKTIDTVLQIVKAALQQAFTRKDIFVGIGGGVITDMTAFAASIYKRGARCQFVPTTLLAMVDAAIGGKSGCDFDEYKNMTGAFFPAEKLFVWPEFVQSLSDEQYRSGFAEAFKHTLLFDKKLFFEIAAQKEKIKTRESDFVFRMIKRSVEAKARIVQKDMLEKHERMLLNFGHTFGHALETCAGLGKIAHGDAVAWGISRALELSCNLGLCSAEYKTQVCELIKYFGWETSAKHSVFNTADSGVKILDAMRRDKKNSSATIRVILQRGLNKNVITEVSDEEILKCL